MQLRTYLRIEGELVSHVNEKVERGSRAISAPRRGCPKTADLDRPPTLANTRFLVRLGEREALPSSSKPPMRRVIEFHATNVQDPSRLPTGSRSPYVVFVVGVEPAKIVTPLELLPNEPDPLDRRSALSLVPAEHVRRRRRLPRLGAGVRPISR